MDKEDAIGPEGEWRTSKRSLALSGQVRSETDLLCCVLVFFVAIIFGLFTCIMFCDQAYNII